MLCDGLQQLLFHKFLVSHWGAEDNDSLRFSSVLVAASPHFRCGITSSCGLLENVAPVWHDPATDPNACFPLVDSWRHLFTNVVYFHCPVWTGDDVQIVQEREQPFLLSQPGGDCHQ